MADISAAYAVIKTRLTSNQPAAANFLRWQNVDGDPLPDTPAAFIYTELVVEERGFVAGYGGGRGANLYRKPALLNIFAFVPRGQGLAPATDLAEAAGALFRSYRDDTISCFDATVYPLGEGSAIKPPGLASVVDNYFCAVCEVNLHFDQVG